MLAMNIIIILIYCLILSFQTVKSGLFCDDQIIAIYVYDESGLFRLLQSVKNPVDCYNVDYVDLDVVQDLLSCLDVVMLMALLWEEEAF